MPSPARSLALPLLAAILWSLAPAAALGQATGDKASRLYSDALDRYEKKDLQGAAIQLRYALQLGKDNLAAHLLLGRVLLAQGEYKAAEASLEEALRQGVSKSEVAPLLGQVYLALGEPRKLLDTLTLAGMPPATHAEVLTLRGTALAMSGNLEGASAAFAEAQKLDPKAAAPLIAEAPILLRAGELQRALQVARRGTELVPDDALAWLQLGNIEQAAGEAQAALKSYDRALTLHPKLVDAHVSRASVLMGLGRAEEARALLDRLKADKVVEPRASYLRAVLAQQAGKAALAKAEFTDAANLVDGLPAGKRSSSEPLLMAGALSHRALGNTQKARDYAEALLLRNNRQLGGQVLLAELMLEAGESTRALTILESVLRQSPNHPQALFLTGAVHLSRKQYTQAAEQFERAGRAGNPDALRELAFSQFGTGQEKLALANLEKAFERNPRDFRAGIELAIYHARRGRGAKALDIAQAMVRRDPGNLDLLNFLGNLHGRLGDNASMRATFERVLAADPKFRQTVMNLSSLDADEGKIDAARARLLSFLKAVPDDIDVLYQLGTLEVKAGRPAVALGHWAKAGAIQGRDIRSALATVDLLLAQGQPDKALAEAKTLLARAADSVAAHHALARAQLASGDAAGARQTLADASKFAGFDAEALALTARLQLSAGNPAGAAHAVSKALQAQPDHMGALILQVETAALRRDAAGVDTAMRALQARHPNQVPTIMTAGHVAMSRQQLPQAIALYRSAYSREPVPAIALTLARAHLAAREAPQAMATLEAQKARTPKDAVILRALAEVQSLQGKNDAARANFEAAVAANPNDPSLLSALAGFQHRLGDAAAVLTAERAMKLAPQQASLTAQYGWLLANKGDVDQGTRLLREARLREPANGEIRWQLATTLAKAGRTAEARDELRAALSSANPPPPGPALDQLKAQVGL